MSEQRKPSSRTGPSTGAEGANAISCPIAAGASQAPTGIAIRFEDRTLSYVDLDYAIRSAQQQFVSGGVTSGLRVALLSDNSADLVIALFALFRIGAVACPLNTRMPPAALQEQVTRLRVRHLVCGEAHAGVVTVAGVKSWQLSDLSSKPGTDTSTAKLVTASKWNLSRPATVLFTSGSTGRPKAVVHSLGNHYFSAVGSSVTIPLDKSDRWLCSLPIFHVGGLAILFRCFLAGCTVDIASARDAPDRLRDVGITHASLVQTQIKRWLDLGGEAGKSLRAVLVGGSSFAPALIEAAIARGLPVHLTYGSTEMASQIATTTVRPTTVREGLSGQILPYRELKIAEDGRIKVRGQTLFLGYFDDRGEDGQGDGELEQPFDEEGWFASSDIGRLTEDGLIVIGRSDNMFISGGENVHPEPIERILSSFPEVRDVVVVPVLDEEFGFRPVAIVDSPNPQLDFDKLKTGVSSVLPSYAVPIRILTWPSDSERDGVSKIDRVAMRQYAEMYLQGENR